MGVKWKTKKNKFPEMKRAAADLNGRRVDVGVFGEQAWLAGIHEYGCRIEVTDRMRAYLHSQGLHLKDSTGYITIPERAFLRNGYDQAKDEVVGNAAAVLCDVISGHMSVHMFLDDVVGLPLESAIKDYATALDNPPNHPFTIARKGSSNPLVGGPGGGGMIDSITHKVE